MSSRTRMKKKPIQDELREYRAKTEGQQNFLDVIEDNWITVCEAPAGTGKTFLSVAKACEYLIKGKIDKIVLSRPTVSSSREFGYLPGSLEEKIHPYLIPLLEELKYFVNVENLIRQGRILIEPLQFMQGRNFKKSFIILDEAQNALYDELVMVISRMHDDSKLVISGSLTQQNLPEHLRGGFEKLMKRLDPDDEKVMESLYDIAEVVTMDHRDIVRSEKLKVVLNALGQ